MQQILKTVIQQSETGAGSCQKKRKVECVFSTKLTRPPTTRPRFFSWGEAEGEEPVIIVIIPSPGEESWEITVRAFVEKWADAPRRRRNVPDSGLQE